MRWKPKREMSGLPGKVSVASRTGRCSPSFSSTSSWTEDMVASKNGHKFHPSSWSHIVGICLKNDLLPKLLACPTSRFGIEILRVGVFSNISPNYKIFESWYQTQTLICWLSTVLSCFGTPRHLPVGTILLGSILKQKNSRTRSEEHGQPWSRDHLEDGPGNGASREDRPERPGRSVAAPHTHTPYNGQWIFYSASQSLTLLQVLSHLIPLKAPWDKHYFYAHFAAQIPES